VNNNNEASQTHGYGVAKARFLALLALIPFDFAQGGLSLRQSACSE